MKHYTNYEQTAPLSDEDVVARISDIANGSFPPKSVSAQLEINGTPPLTRTYEEIVNSIKIATPCKMDWNKMTGDERRRYCQECKLHVYNVSELSAKETVELMQKNTTGRVCMQIYRRKDGTVMTRDCPAAVWKLKKAAKRAAALAAGFVAWVGFTNPAFAQSGDSFSRGDVAVDAGEAVAEPPGQMIMGGAPPYQPPVNLQGTDEPRLSVGGVTPVNIAVKAEAPKLNWAFLVVSLLATLATLRFLLKKKSSMWIIGGVMVTLFAAIGYACTAFAF